MFELVLGCFFEMINCFSPFSISGENASYAEEEVTHI
jgi:hypothetical protein